MDWDCVWNQEKKSSKLLDNYQNPLQKFDNLISSPIFCNIYKLGINTTIGPQNSHVLIDQEGLDTSIAIQNTSNRALYRAPSHNFFITCLVSIISFKLVRYHLCSYKHFIMKEQVS